MKRRSYERTERKSIFYIEDGLSFRIDVVVSATKTRLTKEEAKKLPLILCDKIMRGLIDDKPSFGVRPLLSELKVR